MLKTNTKSGTFKSTFSKIKLDEESNVVIGVLINILV